MSGLPRKRMRRGTCAGLILLGGLLLPAVLTAEESAAPRPTQLLQEIRAEQLRLARRERGLEQRERDVVELETRVGELMAELEQLQATVERRIAAWESDSGDTVKRLAKIYAAMPAPRAAELIGDLDVDLATQIVAKMKHKQSAAVLALLPQERALAMSRQVAHPLRGAPAKRGEAGGR